MPRKRQSPTPAKQNRSDLVAPQTPGAPTQGQAPQVGTGMAYGERKRLTEAQRAMPAPDARNPMQVARDAAKQAPAMRSDTLYQQTARPNEPLTAGVPLGPGPGPEAMPPMIGGAPPPQTDLAVLRPYLPTLELAASQPGASPSFRNWVRRVRAAAGAAQRSPSATPSPR